MAELPTPEFLYFDLGNVLLMFDRARACRQIAEVAGITEDAARRAVFESGLEDRYECGEITSQEFYEAFCEATGSRPDFDALALAASDIFQPNVSMKAVVCQLKAAGYRMGLLSNTCEAHHRFFGGRYPLVPDVFDVAALSYELSCMKPDRRIFERASEMAATPPEKIFFTDDMPGHVAAARDAGWDAVQYTDTPTLVRELRKRGVEFNY